MVLGPVIGPGSHVKLSADHQDVPLSHGGSAGFKVKRRIGIFDPLEVRELEN